MNKLVEPQIGLECELEVNRDDLLIRGFWDRNTDCIIDVRICDVNQPSYFARNSVNILKSAENTKKKHYLEPCLTQRRNFTPFADVFFKMFFDEVY